MSENYKYVQNSKCEYFPCHKVANEEEFNCLFCYCPLYMLGEDCGGNFNHDFGIKDCSNCTIPHTKGGYDYIRGMMDEVIKRGSKRKGQE